MVEKTNKPSILFEYIFLKMQDSEQMCTWCKPVFKLAFCRKINLRFSDAENHSNTNRTETMLASKAMAEIRKLKQMLN